MNETYCWLLGVVGFLRRVYHLLSSVFAECLNVHALELCSWVTALVLSTLGPPLGSPQKSSDSFLFRRNLGGQKRGVSWVTHDMNGFQNYGPFVGPIVLRHLIFRGPKRGPWF